jgi:hypothetical protein
MRIALLLLLFQFFAPSFFPVMVRETANTKASSYFQVPHSSIIAPFLLKENDEKEYEETSSASHVALIIIDFTDHSTNLIASHKRKSNYVYTDKWYDSQPALFTRHCTFLI